MSSEKQGRRCVTIDVDGEPIRVQTYGDGNISDEAYQALLDLVQAVRKEANPDDQ